MQKFYFHSNYLELSAPERFVFRLISYISYASAASIAVIFFLSEKQFLNALAIIFALFLLDRLFYVGKARKSLGKIIRKTDFQISDSKKGAENISAFLSPQSIKLLENAQTRTLLLGGDLQIHLFLLLMRRQQVKRAFYRLELKPEKIIAKAEERLNKTKLYKPKKRETLNAINLVVKKAFQESLNHYSNYISPNDLMLALGNIGNLSIERIYTLFDIEAKDLDSALILSRGKVKKKRAFFSRVHKIRERRMNRAWTARPTPNLDRFSIDITDLIRTGESGFLVGHSKVYDRLLDILARQDSPDLLLIGDPGIGKEAIIYHLAFQITKDKVPKALFDKRLVALDIGALNSSASGGKLEERINLIVREIERAGNIILYIPQIHELVKTSGQMHLSGADILLPKLRTASFSVIGATYPSEYSHYIEENSNFKNIFEPIKVEEINKEEAIRYLSYQSLILESSSNITISFYAVKKAVEIAHKFFRQIPLPSSAENLLKESASDAIGKGKKILTASDIIGLAEKRINVPLHLIGKKEGKDLLNLEEKIHKNYINQDDAVKAVSSALREYRSGLSRSSGPIASFLFVGPTGVGKTELSKILAQIQFGSQENMKRFDMSEYQSSEAITKLIGSSDGKILGSLSELIRKEPYSLVLLDEFEKAHSNLLNIFLQVLDEGRLNDGIGRTVDFSNAIIIATSNAHSTLIKEELEKGRTIASLTEELKRRLTEYFKPELINRFSKIIVFKSLSWQDSLAIAKLNIDKLLEHIKEKKGIELNVKESAVQAITKLGFDEIYGARPLKRAISENINSLLAEKILRQEIQRGESWELSYKAESFVLDRLS